MGCRPQMVFPYLLKYSVNALGSLCNTYTLISTLVVSIITHDSSMHSSKHIAVSVS